MMPRIPSKFALVLALALVTAACQAPIPREPAPAPRPQAPPPPVESIPPPPEPAPQPPPPVQPPPKQFRLAPASTALVSQARTQATAGNYPLAFATLERALRIEPDNPLLWIELGSVHEAQGNHAQANSMGRKALNLAAGDPRAQAAALRLVAKSLRSQGRNQEASEAEQRAEQLSPS